MGLVTSAGALMLMAGVRVMGLAAISTTFVATQNYVFDLEVLAWAGHTCCSASCASACRAVPAGAVWGRSIGVVLAIFSAIAQFFNPYYPGRPATIIALDVAIIWALCVWDRARRPTSAFFNVLAVDLRAAGA